MIDDRPGDHVSISPIREGPLRPRLARRPRGRASEEEPAISRAHRRRHELVAPRVFRGRGLGGPAPGRRRLSPRRCTGCKGAAPLTPPASTARRGVASGAKGPLRWPQPRAPPFAPLHRVQRGRSAGLSRGRHPPRRCIRCKAGGVLLHRMHVSVVPAVEAGLGVPSGATDGPSRGGAGRACSIRRKEATDLAPPGPEDAADTCIPCNTSPRGGARAAPSRGRPAPSGGACNTSPRGGARAGVSRDRAGVERRSELQRQPQCGEEGSWATGEDLPRAWLRRAWPLSKRNRLLARAGPVRAEHPGGAQSPDGGRSAATAGMCRRIKGWTPGVPSGVHLGLRMTAKAGSDEGHSARF